MQRGRGLRAESGNDGFATEARFFQRADDFESDIGFGFYLADESIAIAGFAGGGSGNGAIAGDAKFVHDLAKMAEGLEGFSNQLFTKPVTKKNAFAEAQGVALVMQRFNVQSGIGTGNGETDGVRTGVNGRDMNRLRHCGGSAPEMREGGGGSVLGGANA